MRAAPAQTGATLARRSGALLLSLSVGAAAAVASDAVVAIETFDVRGDSLGSGSGFFISPDEVISCRHVFWGAAAAEVRAAGRSARVVVEVLADDEAADLIRVRVEPSDEVDSPIAPLRLATAPPPSESAVRLLRAPPASPISGRLLGYSVLRGHAPMAEISATILPGDSGSPVVDRAGRVIGVAAAFWEQPHARRNLIVPLERLRRMRAGPPRSLIAWWGEWSLSAEAIFLDGLRQLGAGHRADAIDSFERSLSLDPDYRKARVHLGIALLDGGETARAQELFAEVLARDGGDPEAHKLLGLVSEMEGDLEGALDRYQRASRLEPSYAEAHLLEGLLLIELGRLEDAVGALERAGRLRAYDLNSVHCALYFAHWRLGNDAAADRHAELCRIE